MSTLTSAEMDRVKYECIDNVLGIGAVPYIGIKAVYDIIRDNVSGSSTAATSSSTTVSSAGPTTLTVGSASGMTASSTRIVIDVDAQREVCTIRNVSGLTVSVICQNTHSGTYPVEIESALTIVRGLISAIDVVEKHRGKAISRVGIKAVDEIQFFGASDGGTVLYENWQERARLRMELARACGIEWIVRESLQRRSGPGSMEMY